jgi:hypothetical protein
MNIKDVAPFLNITPDTWNIILKAGNQIWMGYEGGVEIRSLSEFPAEYAVNYGPGKTWPIPPFLTFNWIARHNHLAEATREEPCIYLPFDSIDDITILQRLSTREPLDGWLKEKRPAVEFWLSGGNYGYKYAHGQIEEGLHVKLYDKFNRGCSVSLPRELIVVKKTDLNGRPLEIRTIELDHIQEVIPLVMMSQEQIQRYMAKFEAKN